MNFLKFNKYLQSDNDGTFWPGYIEIPDDEGLPRNLILTMKKKEIGLHQIQECLLD